MSASALLLNLKTALKAHLAGHAPLMAELSGGLHEAPPRGSQPPFLVMGDGVVRENGTNDAESVIAELELHLFTAERGSARALAITALIEARLASQPAMSGGRIVLLHMRDVTLKHDPAKAQTRAAMRLRVFIDPA